MRSRSFQNYQSTFKTQMYNYDHLHWMSYSFKMIRYIYQTLLDTDQAIRRYSASSLFP